MKGGYEKVENFTVCYAFTSGITIEAESEKKAKDLFEAMDENTLYENANQVEITEVFPSP